MPFKLNKIDAFSLLHQKQPGSKTDDEFVVMPREFCVLIVSFLERQVPQKEHLLFNSQNVLGQLEEIKRYL